MEAHVKAFCTLDRAKVKTDWESKIRNFAIRVKIGSQLYTQRVSHNTGSLPGAGGLCPSKYASLILKGTKWYLDSHTMVPELAGFITSPMARGIAYSFLESQGAVAIAGAIVLAPELAAGGPAGVAVDASIAAIGSVMFFAGEAERQQAADDLTEKGSHNKNSKDSDAKNGPKTLDDILEDAEPGRITKGKLLNMLNLVHMSKLLTILMY